MKKLIAFLVAVMISCAMPSAAQLELSERYTIGAITYSLPTAWTFLGEPDNECHMLQFQSNPPTGIITIMSIGERESSDLCWDLSMYLDIIMDRDTSLFPNLEMLKEIELPSSRRAQQFKYLALNKYPAIGMLIDCNDGRMILVDCFFTDGNTKWRDSVFDSMVDSFEFLSDEHGVRKESIESKKSFNIYSTSFKGLTFTGFLYESWKTVDNASISGRVKNNNSYAVDGYFYILFYKNNKVVKSVLAALPLEGLPAGETGSWSTLIEEVNYDRVEYSDSTVYRVD